MDDGDIVLADMNKALDDFRAASISALTIEPTKIMLAPDAIERFGSADAAYAAALKLLQGRHGG